MLRGERKEGFGSARMLPERKMGVNHGRGAQPNGQARQSFSNLVRFSRGNKKPDLVDADVREFSCRPAGYDPKAPLMTIGRTPEDGKSDRPPPEIEPVLAAIDDAEADVPMLLGSFKEEPAAVDVLLAVGRTLDGAARDLAENVRTVKDRWDTELEPPPLFVPGDPEPELQNRPIRISVNVHNDPASLEFKNRLSDCPDGSVLYDGGPGCKTEAASDLPVARIARSPGIRGVFDDQGLEEKSG